ncbi:MAG: CDGSH iron-sulfur domain-containing protein [Thermoplasmatota archaeon]
MASITPLPNGPYKVEGAHLLDGDGNVVKDGALFLCRFGQSANKPFCDGTHAKVGFEG